MVVDIGGGTADTAVVSLGGAVISDSIKIAGDTFDEYISRYVKKKYNMLIGERTAEEIKINIGSAFPRKEEAYMEITGRNLISGLPKTITISSNETIEALQEPLNRIMETMHSVLERTPPELTADISENGICMTGGDLFSTDSTVFSRNGRRFRAMLRRTRCPVSPSEPGKHWRVLISTARARSMTIAEATITTKAIDAAEKSAGPELNGPFCVL